MLSTNTCADSDPKRRSLSAGATSHRGGTANAWMYTPPPNTSLTRFIVSRYMLHSWGVRSPWQSSPGTYYDWRAYAAIVFPSSDWSVHAVETTSPVATEYGDPDHVYTAPMTLRNLFDSGTVVGGIPKVFFEALCQGAPWHCYKATPEFPDVTRWPNPPARLQVRMMQSFLGDSSPPAVEAATGALSSNSVHSGVEQVAFSATDAGGGIYRVVAEARINNSGDWTLQAEAIVDPNGGTCVDAGVNPGDDHEFLHQVPCTLSVTNAGLSVDTSRLPPGNHALRVYVEDAAGNRSAVIADRPFTVISKLGAGVLDRPAAAPGRAGELDATNGSGASARAVIRLNRARQTVGFGRVTKISGRLVDEQDAGIAGATLSVQERTYIPKTGLEGPTWKPLGNVATAAGGTFVARIPAGSSRAVRFIYRANPRQEGYTTAAEARIAVRAGVGIRALRRSVRNGMSAVFTGRIAGAVPRAGVLVTLQGLIPGRGWTPVRTTPSTVRARSDGRFRISYRFTRTYRSTTYRFRVLVNEDSRFAYRRSASRVLKVTVRP